MLSNILSNDSELGLCFGKFNEQEIIVVITMETKEILCAQWQ